MNIAVDVFGGDNAPQAILDGCMLALEQNKDMHLILVGEALVIEKYLSEHAHDANRIRIKHAPEIITIHEQPTVAIKHKKDSSLVQALMCVVEGDAGCMVSAGSTGAVLAGATLLIRRLKGVKRPALAPIMPTRDGCILLVDCGANIDCKPQYLQQFAVMGSAYMQHVMGLKSPRIGLLNNGAEAEKGNELTKATYGLMLQTPVNFVGNCEGRDVLSGDFDVVVCDGFSGNIVLKNTEGVAALLVDMLKDELMRDKRSKIAAVLAKPAFRRFKSRMDYTEYGGAPLLGVNGGVIKAHGSSNAKAFAAALKQARAYVLGNVTEAIGEAIAAMEPVEE
ncbi:MAG: phosphate acyltransferase PlsX [Bacillota bacterium]